MWGPARLVGRINGDRFFPEADHTRAAAGAQWPGTMYTSRMATKPPLNAAEEAILEATGIAGGPECLVHWTCPKCGGTLTYAIPRMVPDVLLVGERHRGYSAASEYLNTMAGAAERCHAPECAIRN